MDFTKFNKGSFKKIEWGIDTKEYKFVKIKDLVAADKKTVTIRGLFFTKSEQFGLQPNAIIDGALLNLPTHIVDTVKEMLNDDGCVAAIKRGECGVTFRKYDSKYRKDCWGVDFINLTPTAEQPLIF